MSSAYEDKFVSIFLLPASEERKGEGGLRTKGIFKKSYDDKPLISIITVVYNGEKHLEQTIQSVISQTYKNVEYIIIDGGSTDGTLDIIHKYEHMIDYWVSEKDAGIYDAMNKGISLAAGEWIGLINADDWYESNACEAVAEYFKKKSGAYVFHGIMKMYDESTKYLYCTKPAKRYSLLKKGMVIDHPATFISRSLYKEYGLYGTHYKIAADWDLILRLYLAGVEFVSINQVFANFRAGGVSSEMNYFGFKEKHTIRVSNRIVKYFDKYYCYDRLKMILFGRYLPKIYELKQKMSNA